MPRFLVQTMPSWGYSLQEGEQEVFAVFVNRKDAGQQLASVLAAYKEHPTAIVLGIPRGGVVVAAEVARLLSLPLDVVIAAKVGAPMNPEFAAGAVAPDGVVTPNEGAGFSAEDIEVSAARAHETVRHRLEAFRAGRKPLSIADRTAILVDDGIATGLTMRAAAEYARRQAALRVVVAAPVVAPDAALMLARIADEVVALKTPASFWAVGQFYDEFGQTDDREVIRLLKENGRPDAPAAGE